MSALLILVGGALAVFVGWARPIDGVAGGIVGSGGSSLADLVLVVVLAVIVAFIPARILGLVLLAGGVLLAIGGLV